MGARRTRTIEAVCLLGLCALALRPVGVVERALDTMLVTSRWLPELSVPLAQVQAAASGGVSATTREAEANARQALETALQDAAAPPFDLRQREELEARGVDWVHAEVLARSQRSLDTLLVRVADPALVELDQPVVCGDVFVGKVTALPGRTRLGMDGPGPRIAEVTLVTSRHFRVGAQVRTRNDRFAPWQDEPHGMLVVGGIVDGTVGGRAVGRSARADAFLLGAHHPQDRSLTEGLVVVAEPDEALPGSTIPSLHLANGFRLGELRPEAAEIETRTQRLAGIVPALDYAAGLYQLTILVSRTRRPASPPDPIASLPWREARMLLRGETSVAREGRKLGRGRDTGVESGAALADGVRLVGRVGRSGIGWSDLLLLGDAGTRLPGLAALGAAHDPRPFALGDLVALGRDGDGNLLLRWDAIHPLLDEEGQPATAASRATLWSGSGSPGLPRGLLIGMTVLPPGPGPHELVVTPPGRPDAGTGLRVVCGGAAR